MATTTKARRPVSPLEKTQAEVMAACGLSWLAIAKALGRSRSVIQYWLLPSAKEYSRAKEKQRRLAKGEEIKQKNRDWYARNIVTARLQCRNWRERNIAYLREKDRLAYWSNKEYYKSKHKDWCNKNRDKVREKNRKRQARKAAAVAPNHQLFSLSDLRTRMDCIGQQCIYCNANGTMTVDHVVALNKGGLDCLANMVPACRRCNCSKRDEDVYIWYRRQPFFSQQSWQRLQQHCPHVAEAVA